MKPSLYHYVHCPYCIRIRMAAGFLNITYESHVVRYDDEETPVRLCGRKMLPIWVNENGNAVNESLDIIHLIDEKNYFKTKDVLSTPKWKDFQDHLDKLSGPIFSLSMPQLIWTKEFDEKSREYFQRKKEEKRGPFKNLVKNRIALEDAFYALLEPYEKKIKTFYDSDQLSLYDIVLASQLWSLYIVPEFQFSEKTHAYLQRVKKDCHFDYHSDYWK